MKRESSPNIFLSEEFENACAIYFIDEVGVEDNRARARAKEPRPHEGAVRQVGFQGSCWCPTVRKMVLIQGEKTEMFGTHLDKLFVLSCIEDHCQEKTNQGCLIHKRLEGRWR